MGFVKLLSGGGNGRRGYTAGAGSGFAWLGTLNYVVKSGALTLEDGLLYDNGAAVGIGTTTALYYKFNVWGSTNGNVAISVKNASIGNIAFAGLILSNGLSDLASELSMLSSGFTATTVKFPSCLYLANRLAAGAISINAEGATGKLYFGTNNTFREIINENGYHGIHTNAPLCYLQIETGYATTVPMLYFSMDTLAHGMTGVLPTNVFAAFRPMGGGVIGEQPIAGLRLTAIAHEYGGVGGWECPLTMDGYYAGTGPTTVPCITLNGAKQNGTSVQSLADNQRILRVCNQNELMIVVMGNGWIGQFGGAYPHETAPDCALHTKKSVSSSSYEMCYLIDNTNPDQGDGELFTYNISSFIASVGDSNIQGVLRAEYQSGRDGVWIGSITDHYLFLIQNNTVRAIIDPAGFLNAKYKSWDGTAGFTGTGAYTNFTIKDGIVTAAS
jgi:hypothetical protein